MHIQGSIKSMLQRLMLSPTRTVAILAQELRLSRNTLYRIIQGKKFSGKTKIKIINFYVQNQCI
jgi:predicted transcriptional regulator